MSKGTTVTSSSQHELFSVNAGDVPEITSAEEEWVRQLDDELRQDRPTALGALLTATVLLRIAAVGAGIAIQFDITDLAGGRPNGLAIGVVGASQAITEMVFAPVLARYADRFGRSRFLVAGPALGMLGALLLAFGVTPLQLGLTRLIEGVGAAAFVPVALALVAASTTHDPAGRAKASGAFEGATLAGYAGGFLLGGFAWHQFHRACFLILAVVYLVAALVCMRFVPRIPPLPVSSLRSVLRVVLGPGPMRAFLPAWLCCWALLGSFLANLPALLRHRPVAGQELMRHLDERLIVGVLVAWIGLFLVGIALWTRYLEHRRPMAVMRKAVPGAWLIVLGLLLLNHLGFTSAWLCLPILGVGILMLAGFGPAAVTYLADCSEVLAADRSALMSFYTVALAGGGAAGAVLGGVATRALQADGLLVLGLLLSLVTFSLLLVAARDEAPHLGSQG